MYKAELNNWVFTCDRNALSNFVEGGTFQFTCNGKQYSRKIRFSYKQGLHFVFNNYCICYEDFN